MPNSGISLEYLLQIEEKWQKIWRERKIYSPEVDPAKPKFFITVPYPYTSGALHIGHGRTYVTGDIIARFKRLFGFNVLFPMAFHVTGMPILAISDRIRRGDQKIIALYRKYVSQYVEDESDIEKIVNSFKEPLNVAIFFANNIQRDFESIGLGIDWTRKFHTAEPIYNKFVEWQYKKLYEKGLIVKGTHYVRYCLLHKQSVGEDDIADGDVNPVYIQEFVAIKFKFEDGFILAATLRPETIYGATNMWVNPKATYVKIKITDLDEIWYLSEEAYTKLRHQYPYHYQLIERLDGTKFIGKTVISPLGQQLIILPASFVDPDRATGFVYSEPADAPYDYVALLDLKKNRKVLEEYGVDPSIMDNIIPKKIIDMPSVDGIYTEYIISKHKVKDQNDPTLIQLTEEVYKEQYYKGIMNKETGDLAGIPVKKARDIVRERMLKENKAIIFYETSRKAFCRAGGKIIVARIQNQWFIDYSKDWWKEKSREWLQRMMIIPEKYRKLFEDTIDWLSLRPCARGRGLGTKLPFDKQWVIESLSDSTIYMAFYTIANIIRENIDDPEKLIPEVFDYVFLGKGDINSISEKSGIPVPVLNKMRTSFEYWYPNDLRHTATPHITNHLTFFIMHHIAVFPEKYWPRGISINALVIREGKKMAKSKGNVIPLTDIAKRYSADLYRLYVASGADLDGTVDWKETEVEKLKRSLLNFVKLVLDSTRIAEPKLNFDSMDKWLISRFYSRLKLGKEKVENFRLRDYVISLFYEMMNDISHYRRRTGSSEDKILNAIRFILRDWIIALSPIIPHISEEVWSRINRDPEKWSINLAGWPQVRNELIDRKIEYLEETLIRLIDLGRDLKHVLKGKKINKAKIVIAAEWKYRLAEKVKSFFDRGIRNLGTIMREISQTNIFRPHMKEINMLLKKMLSGKLKLPFISTTQQDELRYLIDATSYIKTELEINSVEFLREETIPEELRSVAKNAFPGKPIIVYD